MSFAETDRVESILKDIDESTVKIAGGSLFHILTVGSIAASVALFLSGKKWAGIFVRLWPATFQAQKSASQH
jgi:hypothetical protein